MMKTNLKEIQVTPIDHKFQIDARTDLFRAEVQKELEMTCKLRWHPIIRLAYDKATKTFFVTIILNVIGKLKKVRLYVQHLTYVIDLNRLHELMGHDALWSFPAFAIDRVWRETKDPDGKPVASTLTLDECESYAEMHFNLSADHLGGGKIFEICGEYFCCDEEENRSYFFRVHDAADLTYFEDKH